MSEASSGPPDPLPPSAAAWGSSRARCGRPEFSAWDVGIPALLGAVLGALVGVVWRALYEPGRSAEDTIGLLIVALTVGPPVLVVVSWVVLALTGPAWTAPTVTIAGLAAGSFAVALYLTVTDTSGAPPVALCALAWGASYAAVAVACLPRVSWLVRGAMVALLVTPAILLFAL
ncbi:hypothetical protein [Micromonospora sp. KC213]|uniref:hypothetical protein n=1 Tax=Micromonospora sp. KC213 TaxID=2530378 RepID=UPI00104C3589|nr:hypothetical protein [Micromonospora sp. KC213]TDC38521.1 hypothetical protein E1166_18305 [Micromonospora sp. KC213]